MLHFLGVVFLISLALAIIVRFPLVRYFMTFILTFCLGFLILFIAWGNYEDKLAVYAICGVAIFFCFAGLGALLMKITPSALPIATGLFFGSVIPSLFCGAMFVATKFHLLD